MHVIRWPDKVKVARRFIAGARWEKALPKKYPCRDESAAKGSQYREQ
jgi:hypothetical protein